MQLIEIKKDAFRLEGGGDPVWDSQFYMVESTFECLLNTESGRSGESNDRLQPTQSRNS